jgi:hypothetical protein
MLVVGLREIEVDSEVMLDISEAGQKLRLLLIWRLFTYVPAFTVLTSQA